jgi:hypothetical protein
MGLGPGPGQQRASHTLCQDRDSMRNRPTFLIREAQAAWNSFDPGALPAKLPPSLPPSPGPPSLPPLSLPFTPPPTGRWCQEDPGLKPEESMDLSGSKQQTMLEPSWCT